MDNDHFNDNIIAAVVVKLRVLTDDEREFLLENLPLAQEAMSDQELVGGGL